MTKVKQQIVLFLLCIICLLPGCWDRRELDELAIAAALGIDTDAEGLKVTVQLIRPQGVQSGTSSSNMQGGAYWVLGARGDTIFDAIRNLSLLSSRKPFFPHTQLIVFGEETAKQGFSQHLDFLARDPEIRTEAFVLVVKGKAADFLTRLDGFSRVSALGYAELMNNLGATSKFAQTTLSTLARQSLTPGIDPVVTLAEPGNPVDPTARGLPFNLDSGAMQKQPQKEDIYVYSGAAVFRGDKMAGELTTLEARGLLWVLNKVKSGVIVVPAPQGSGKTSLEILGAKAKVKPQIKDGQISFAITIKAEALLAAVDAPVAEEMWKPDQMEELAALLSQQIETEVLAAMQKAQTLRADIFGFGQVLRQQKPRAWQDVEAEWVHIFPQVRVEVAVESHLKEFGLITFILPKQQP